MELPPGWEELPLLAIRVQGVSRLDCPHCTGCYGLLLFKKKKKNQQSGGLLKELLFSGEKCYYLGTGKASAVVGERVDCLLHREPPAGPSL